MSDELEQKTTENPVEPVNTDSEPAETPSENSVSESTKPRSAKVLWLGLVMSAVIVLLGLGGVATYGVYNASENPTIVSLASFFRIPVAQVNDQPILYRDYVSDLNSLRTFYNGQKQETAYNAEEQSDQVLSRLIANNLVKQVAKEMNVTVSEEEKDKAHADILSRFDNDEAKLAADIKKNLGLEIKDFYNRILEPTLLEKKVAEQFATSSEAGDKAYEEEQVKASHILFPVKTPADDAKVKAQAVKVLAQIKAGASFADLAKQYGTDSSKDNGGDLGWFGRGAMVKEFEDIAFTLKKGDLAVAPIKTEFGYHIIKVEDKRSARNFSLYMNDILKKAEIEIFGKVHNPFANLNTSASPAQIEPSVTVE